MIIVIKEALDGRYQVRIRALLYAIPSNLKCVTFDFPAFYTISF